MVNLQINNVNEYKNTDDFNEELFVIINIAIKKIKKNIKTNNHVFLEFISDKIPSIKDSIFEKNISHQIKYPFIKLFIMVKIITQKNLAKHFLYMIAIIHIYL